MRGQSFNRQAVRAAEGLTDSAAEPAAVSARDFSTSLARGLQVITAFDSDHDMMTLSDVARRTGMTRAAARRFLLTLGQLGYVVNEGRLFRLTPRTLNLGFSYLSSTHIWERAQPFMEQLVDQVQESCSISVLEGDDIVYVARMPTKRIMSVALGIGTRLPAYCTSMGRVLLAGMKPQEVERYLGRAEFERLTPHTATDRGDIARHIETARREGFAMVDQELEVGLRSIAVPIRSKSGRLVAAMNVSGHASRVTLPEMRARFLPALLYAAEGISLALP